VAIDMACVLSSVILLLLELVVFLSLSLCKTGRRDLK